MAGKRRNPEIISGRVNADGTIAAGDGFTVQRTAAGTYHIFLLAGFRLVSAITNMTTNTVNTTTNANTFGPGDFWVSTYATSTGTAADQAFAFVAVGVQT